MTLKKMILIKIFLALFIFSLGIAVGLLITFRSTLQKSVVIDEQSKPKDAVIEKIITPIEESVKTRKYTDLTCGFEITIPKDMVETVESQGKPCNKVRFFQNQRLKEDYLAWKATNPNPITDKNMDQKPVGLSFLVSNFDENNLEEPGNDTWLNKDQTDNIPQDFKIYVGGAYDVPYNMCATKKEGSNYYISFSDCDQNLYDNPIFQQILSSFRFTNPTASWSTYQNQKYGFEFKFPPTAHKKGDDEGSSFCLDQDGIIETNCWGFEILVGKTYQSYLSQLQSQKSTEKLTPGQVKLIGDKEFNEFEITYVAGRPQKCLMANIQNNAIILCNFSQDILDTFKIVK